MNSQYEKAVAFRQLHQESSAFIIPNPWDIASTKIISHFGFKAIATSSAALALSNGVQDGTLHLEQILIHLKEISSATDLPVTADLGNGCYDNPQQVYDTIIKAAETGIVGASIEDVNKSKSYPLALAVERIQAASEAAKSLDFPFTLTARADNYFIGTPNINDTIKRLQAYQTAGADVLFAPGIKTKETIQSILSEIDKPLNVLMGLHGNTLDYNDLNKMGVKRISLGASLYRTAMSSFVNTIQNLRQNKQFNSTEKILSFSDISNLFKTDA